MRKPKLLLLAVLLVVGCTDSSPPTIDTSSEESMQESIANVRQSLPESDRAAFDAALLQLKIGHFDFEELITLGTSGDTGKAALENRFNATLEDKTGAEVLAAAEALQVESEKRRLEQEAQRREQNLAEIDELESRLAAGTLALVELEKFEVVRSRFFQEEEQFFGTRSVIELTVRNGTNQPVSRAYFEGIVASPERAVPWITETFNYQIAGGLESGEEASWRLSPNSFSDWGTVDVPDDAILTVTAFRLDGADGEPVFNARSLSDRELQRLDTLRTTRRLENQFQ